MEIPVINRISDFEAGINSLQNPSFLSQASSISGIEKVFQAYSFWKWGAVIIALVATFSRIINRIKILIIRFRQHNSLASEPLFETLDDDDYSSDDDTLSYSSSDDEEDEETIFLEDRQQLDEDFCVAGSSYSSENQWQNRNLKLRRRRRSIQDLFSWSEFANGKSVVKLWDNLGLGLDLNNTSDRAISIYDMNKETKISSIFGRNIPIPATSTSSPPLIMTAETTEYRNCALKFWDMRVGCQIPAILAEWRPRLEKIVSVYSGGIEKVYVEGGGAAELTVGDMRNVSSSLANFTEADVETWWDANAVMNSD